MEQQAGLVRIIPEQLQQLLQPAAGYSFVNWTEGANIVSTSSSYAFTVTGTRTLVANFTPITYTITLSSNPTAGGSTTGSGTFNLGTSVTVTATPATGYQFVNWTENGSQVSTSASYIFTIAANRTLVANFAQITYTVTLSSNPPAGGTTAGGGTFNPGTSVTVTATPATGYQFVNWTENGSQVSTSASYIFTIAANRTLVANFAQITYTVTLSSNPPAGGTTAGGGTFNPGTSVTVTATPATGYQFVNWTENGSQVSTSASYIFTIAANRTLVANFTATSTGNTSVTVSPSTAQYSDRVTFTATITGGASLPGGWYGYRATFRVGTQVMGSVNLSRSGNNLVGSLTTALLETVNNQMAPGIRPVTATFSRTYGSLSGVSPNPATTSLTITREDARVEYTGTYLVAASGSGSSRRATLTLSATIRDITNVTGDPAYDQYAGDIREARVRFLKGSVPITGWLTPSLIYRNQAVGRVSATWTADNSSANDVTNDIFIEVGGDGYYTRSNPADASIATVYVPSQNYLAGGGYLVNPSNVYGADQGLRTNFGFIVKFSNSGSNPYGPMDIIFRRTVDGELHTFQIKSSAITSVSVSSGNRNNRTAVINATATLDDLTNPSVSMSGLTLRVTMSDRSNSGSSDRIGITLWNGTTILFSSSRNGSSTSDREIGDGNLIVQSGSISGSISGPVSGSSSEPAAEVQETITPRSLIQPEFGVKAYPNPFVDRVNFDLQLKTDSKVKLEIYTMAGSKLATLFDDVVVAFDKYRVEYTPENFSTGTLIYRLTVDGKLMFTGKLIHY